MTKSRIDALCSALQSARDARIRAKKASIMEDYLRARRLVRETYRDYAPEELPVDVNRVSRDIDIERDCLIDDECDRINDDFKIAIGILRLVAERNPEFYDEIAKEVGDDRRGWRQQRRRRNRKAPTTALPMSVVAKMSASAQGKVIDHIVDHPDGSTFRELCALIWKDPDGPSKKALRTFLKFLRDGGHIRDDGGSTSGMKYLPSGSLEAVAKLYAGDEGGQDDE